MERLPNHKAKYGQVGQNCKSGVRKMKVQNELRLAKNAKTSQKVFVKYI